MTFSLSSVYNTTLLVDSKTIDTALSGLFSFVIYRNPRLFAMRCFEDWKSYHGAIDLFVKMTYRSYQPKSRLFNSQSFFQPSTPIPVCGGEMLLEAGPEESSQIVLYNFKSGCFSKNNSAYADVDPDDPDYVKKLNQLKSNIKALGLPPDRYIPAQRGLDAFLYTLFHSNGKLIATHNRDGVLNEICDNIGTFPFGTSKYQLPPSPTLAF